MKITDLQDEDRIVAKGPFIATLSGSGDINFLVNKASVALIVKRVNAKSIWVESANGKAIPMYRIAKYYGIHPQSFKAFRMNFAKNADVEFSFPALGDWLEQNGEAGGPNAKTKKFLVWFPQINQTCVEVVAKTRGEAYEKAERKWRREYGHNTPSYIEEQKPTPATSRRCG